MHPTEAVTITTCKRSGEKSLGLAEEYKAENQELKKSVQKMAAVSFCPPTFVRPAWLAVQQDAQNLPQVDQLIAYFDHTWLNGQFPCRSWNYFDHPGPRTNNHMEGWHSRLKKVVGKPHPNIYELVDVIKREEATYNKNEAAAVRDRSSIATKEEI